MIDLIHTNKEMKSDPESPNSENNLDYSSPGFPAAEILESERSNQNNLKNNIGEAKKYDINSYLINQSLFQCKQESNVLDIIIWNS